MCWPLYRCGGRLHHRKRWAQAKTVQLFQGLGTEVQKSPLLWSHAACDLCHVGYPSKQWQALGQWEGSCEAPRAAAGVEVCKTKKRGTQSL